MHKHTTVGTVKNTANTSKEGILMDTMQQGVIPTTTTPVAATGTVAQPDAVAQPQATPAGQPLGTTAPAMAESAVSETVMNEPAITAAELLGMNPGDFETTKFEKFPTGRFMFKIAKMGLDVKDTKNGPTNVIEYELEVVQVISVTQEGVTEPEKLMGRTFYDNHYLNGANREEVATSIGRHNGHVAQLLGIKEIPKEYGQFSKLFETLTGRVFFIANISAVKNDKDPDDPFANLNTRAKLVSHRELAELGQLPAAATAA